MKFGPRPLEQARGKILAHNVTGVGGRRILRKGRVLDDEAVELLRELQMERVYVAELEEGDVPEDEAAVRVARVISGTEVELGRPHAGRVNIQSRTLGVLRVNITALDEVNQVEGLTVATLATHTVVQPGVRLATVKVIPYALSESAVSRAEALGVNPPVVAVHPIRSRKVGVVLVGGESAWEGLGTGMGEAIRGRVEVLEGRIRGPVFAQVDERALAAALSDEVSRGAELIVVAGETAIMDENDLIPRGIRSAGGRIEHLGLAMDPGHLLLLGYLDGVPVVGAPGCVRGASPDGFDAVLPRLLSGERLTRHDLQALGHGGLLSNPRDRRTGDPLPG